MRTRLEAGEFRAVVDRAYRLEAIADADGYVEKGKKTGILVLNVTSVASRSAGSVGASERRLATRR